MANEKLKGNHPAFTQAQNVNLKKSLGDSYNGLSKFNYVRITNFQ